MREKDSSARRLGAGYTEIAAHRRRRERSIKAMKAVLRGDVPSDGNRQIVYARIVVCVQMDTIAIQSSDQDRDSQHDIHTDSNLGSFNPVEHLR